MSKHRGVNLNQHGRDFIKTLETLRPSKNAYEVFSDWLVLAAAFLYTWKKDPAVKEEYLQVAGKYKKDELEKHSELLAITVNALEEKEQDFLGEVFTMAELTDSRNGQFFTPYHISKMMAYIAIGDKEYPKTHVCKISDPCCGAGGMLIASAQVMKERGFNYQYDALFVGQDVDARCARMAYIQLSLLGVPALIICGDTLLMKTYWQRETIGYHLSGMEYRLKAEKLLNIIRDMESAPAQAEEENAVHVEEEKQIIKITLPRRELVQGELF